MKSVFITRCSSVPFAKEKNKYFCQALLVNTLLYIGKYSTVLKVIFLLKSKMLHCVHSISPYYSFDSFRDNIFVSTETAFLLRETRGPGTIMLH